MKIINKENTEVAILVISIIIFTIVVFLTIQRANPAPIQNVMKETKTTQNIAEEQYMLGVAHYKGKGVEQNYRKAVHLWLKAAYQGNADAQYMLSQAYQTGTGVITNQNEAYIWLSIANVMGTDLTSNYADFSLQLRVLSRKMKSRRTEKAQEKAKIRLNRIENQGKELKIKEMNRYEKT